MEKTIDTQSGLTPAEMIEEMKKDAMEVASPENMSAAERLKASIMAGKAFAEHLLMTVIPQVLEYLWVCGELLKNNEASPDDPAFESPWTIQEVMTALKKGVDDLKAHPVSTMRRAVHLAILRFQLGQPKTEQEASETLAWAIREGYLTPAMDAVNNGFWFKPEDREEILRLVGALRGKQLLAVEARATKPVAPPVPQKPRTSDKKISAIDAWNGILGRFQLVIPNGKNAMTFQMESQLNEIGEVVLVVTGILGHSNGHAGLAEKTMPLSAIKDENGSVSNGLIISPPPMCSGERLHSWMQTSELLGNTLKRGFSAVLAEEKHKAEARDPSPEEFLSPNSDAVGTTTLTFRAKFNWDDPEVVIPNLSLRFERRDNGQIGLVEIVSKEEEAKTLFGGAVGKFYDPDSMFKGMRMPQVVAFLRLLYGQEVQKRVYS